MAMITSLFDIPAIAHYLKRIGAEPRSLRTAVVRENHGNYWKDLAVIKFTEGGDVSTSDEYMPLPPEALAIAEACKNVEWPKHKLIKRLVDLPDEIKKADQNDIFEFRDSDGNIVMLQVRRTIKGEKAYIPWTYWSDGQWRKMEPEGKLPLWGIDKIKDVATVFIHEGAKAARYTDWMVRGETKEARDALAACPWGDELSGAGHVGWIGGALSPYRTDWSALKRAGVKRAYIIADNDDAGRSAVPNIAQQIRFPTFLIQFTDEWPASFDMADKWPKKMFKVMEGKSYYTGPAFRECLHPATWATDLVPNKKGRPSTVLRDNFKDMWAYVEDADTFVCTEMPEIVRNEKILNNMLASFSHTSDTTRLMLKAFRGRSTKICYRPDIEGRVVTNKGTSAINLHVKCAIKAVKGNPEPFLRFMNYLFPNDEERQEMLRWVATIIAHPEVRMEYGVLLVSEAQGIGKTTLGTAILAPLVGDNNVSFPGENDITNPDFNGWIAHKRLAIINEIYSGHSWKAYNKLKSLITDKDIRFNDKYQKAYTIENWCHIYACSNSMRALKMEEDDRRWFYPEVTEKRWAREKFVELHSWLQGGGLSIIKQWAIEFENWVIPGQRAPMTKRKADLIEGSMTEAQKEVTDLARAMENSDQLVAVAMKDVENWAKQAVKGRMYDSEYDLRKALKANRGVKQYERGRLYVGGRLQYVIVNIPLYEAYMNMSDEEAKALVLKSMKAANDVLPVSL